MMGLHLETIAFLTAVISGMIAVCAYACVRTLRKVIPHSARAVALEDALYWIAASVYLYAQIYHVNSGSIRWFFVAGTGLGAGGFLMLTNRLAKRIENMHKKTKKNS